MTWSHLLWDPHLVEERKKERKSERVDHASVAKPESKETGEVPRSSDQVSVRWALRESKRKERLCVRGVKACWASCGQSVGAWIIGLRLKNT